MTILEDNPDKRSLYPHIIPISGLAESSIARLFNECSTTLELWSRKVKPKAKYRKSISNEDLAVINQLKHIGINPNSIDDNNRTPLHVYCRPGGELGVNNSLFVLLICFNFFVLKDCFNFT